MTKKVIVFDFDGTIADTYQAIVDITNDLSSEFGYQPMSEEELLLFKNLSSKDIVKRTEISLFKIPFLVKRVQKELGHQIADLAPIKGIESVLIALKQRDYVLGIVTSNVEKNVIMFLQKNNLEYLFDFIYSGTNIFGKHRIINEIVRKRKLKKTDVIYVGDETRDIRSARKSGIGIIAVGWGFNSQEILAEYQPDFLAANPTELLEAISPSPVKLGAS
ncbi:haloacid dehalogenase superfamily enzyme, subfamily IA [Xenococcus sp. PCC 7305]|uniref:HAD-IA family hydrolase n=1 Tax=Xenococcus sp. PCC 7305 TaxID=102125 RepID=UPI0002ACDCD8|nr:HAD-IA family hydrolase [Xenococcus sp. PCC 7305]ELS00348.1 haloacid dehalogenase superfamily enzyme, subfamily IA [Xenococcus sp. PCC 7305]